MKFNPYINLLEESLKKMNLEVEPLVQKKLMDYLELLAQWNTIHNLTAIREPKEMVIKHLLDSLSILPFLSGKRILDVGTGAGLPGIPLSLIKPENEFCLIDSNQKKINFVQHAILSLNLSNIEAICVRAERYKPEALFDCIVSRAFGTLAEFIQNSGHLGSEQGRWLAMKAKRPQEELAALPKGYTIEQIHSITVPHLTGERCVIIICRDNPKNVNGGLN